MGVCPTPARHVARPTLCVSGLCHRLPRAGLGATQTTTDPVRDRWVRFPYPHSLGTLVGITSGASGLQGGGGGYLQVSTHVHTRPHVSTRVNTCLQVSTGGSMYQHVPMNASASSFILLCGGLESPAEL